MYSRRGLAGPSIGTILTGGSTVDPEPISKTVLAVLGAIFNMSNMFGAGRREADMITPTQNEVMRAVGAISDAYTQTNSIPQLQQWMGDLRDIGTAFVNFTRDPRFKDGRASHQARNSVMPYIDGTDGEGNAVMQSPFGPVPEGGTIGQIARRILSLGGSPMMPPAVIQGTGSTVPRLTVPSIGQLPQAGTLPPQVPSIWDALTGRNSVPALNPYSQQSAGMDTTTMLLIGGLAIAFLTMRNRR